MNRFLQNFIAIEKSIQVATIVGAMLFLGYFLTHYGLKHYVDDLTPALPSPTAPTTQP